MKLRTGKTVRGGREPPLGERRTGASFLPFAEKRKRSQPQTFFTLQYFFTKPRGNAAGLCTPQRRLFKRKPPCGKHRRPIYGVLRPPVAACMVQKAHARQGETATSRQLRTTGARATRRNFNFAAARRHGGQALQSETATSRRLYTAETVTELGGKPIKRAILRRTISPTVQSRTLSTQSKKRRTYTTRKGSCLRSRKTLFRQPPRVVRRGAAAFLFHSRPKQITS